MTVTRILEIQNDEDVDVLRRPAVEGVCFSARLTQLKKCFSSILTKMERVLLERKQS